MKEEWTTARNLCRMSECVFSTSFQLHLFRLKELSSTSALLFSVLMYEPDHKEANEFKDVIEQKIQMSEDRYRKQYTVKYNLWTQETRRVCVLVEEMETEDEESGDDSDDRCYKFVALLSFCSC